MLRLAFDFIITWRETRTRPNAYNLNSIFDIALQLYIPVRPAIQHHCCNSP